jgi:protease-4
MKDFLKYTLASMTGMILLGVIMGILGIISIVGMVASESATAPIEDNSVFVLSLKGMVEERSSGDINPLNYFSGNTEESVGLNDILHAIKVAKENDKIKGIYIESGIVAFDSYATARTLRNALIDFKKSGKWVIAYADSYLQGAYYVSTAADKVYMDNFGSIDLKGIGTKAEYYKGLYDKIGIRYDATRVGKYKSYVERNTRTSMSPEDREQRMAYMQGLWNIITKDIAASRHLTAAVINKYANDSLMALADQQSYIKMKLIDKVMYPDEVKSDIKTRARFKRGR